MKSISDSRKQLPRVFSTVAVCLLVAIAQTGRADLVGPYTPDADTLFLFHFDEAAGGSMTANAGSHGGVSYSVDLIGALPTVVTTMLGSAGYSSGGINFGNAMNNPDPAYLFGYDANNSGDYTSDPTIDDFILMTNLNIGNGGQTPFTIEALIAPTTLNGNQEIVCTDRNGGVADRGFQFRITGGDLEFHFIGGNPSLQQRVVGIPTTGTHAFVADEWFHVALAYDGTTLRMYWTRLDPSVTAANQIGTFAMTLNQNHGAVNAPFIIGNENRATGNSSEGFAGRMDEVRISSVARAASEMQFFSSEVTIVQQPASQGIDNAQPVTFTSLASSLLELGYQWRFNGTSIVGATNTSYSIPAVDLVDAGDYDVVVTNTASFASTSQVAVLTVGAAQFLTHRWSFTTDTSDSIGGATGVNQGTATVTGGALVLDGAIGTYMELPPFLLSSLTAVTFDFWATFGENADNNRVFDFGNTNFVNATVPPPQNYVYFSPRTGGETYTLGITGGSSESQQNVTGDGLLDGQTVHVTCVVDPPSGVLSIYTNGVLSVANTNLSVSMASLNDELCWIGRSLFAADPYLNASIDELRIYSGALSAVSVQQSEAAGPDDLLSDGPVELVAEPVDFVTADGQLATFSSGAVGHAPILYQWYENDSPIAGATNPVYSFIAASGDDGDIFQVRATNNVTGTNYFAISSNATLTITIPKMVAWTGANSANWDTSTLNWTSESSPAMFAQFDDALFDAQGSGQPNVDIVQPTSVTGLTVDSSTDYLFTSSGANGSLNGTTTLMKQGTGKLTVDVPNNLSEGTLIQSGTLQIGNGTGNGTLGGGVVVNNATLSFNRTNALTVTNDISGAGQVTMDGTGSVALSGSNSYAGVTVISSGTLNARNAAALGTADAGTTATGGGQLFIDANVDILGESLTLGGDAPSALRKGGAGATTLGGPVMLVADTTIQIDGGATLNLTHAGGITGSSVDLTLVGDGVTAAGTVSGPVSLGSASLTNAGGVWRLLSPVNNYTGKTYITGGRLEVGAASGLGAAPGAFTADQITLNGGSLGAHTNFTLDDGLRGITVGPDFEGGVSANAGVTLTIANEITGVMPFTKSGAGTVVLSGPNDGFLSQLFVDTGSTTDDDGILRIASSAAIASTDFIISIRNNNAGSSTLQLDGSAESINLSQGIVPLAGRNNTTPALDNLAGTNTLSGDISMDVGGSQYRIQSSSGLLKLGGYISATTDTERTITFQGSGDISISDFGTIADGVAAVNVVKEGSGTLMFDTFNGYSGTTTISNGVLTVTVNSSIDGPGAVIVAGGALGGTGDVYTPVTVQPGGALAPGASVGTLALYDNLTLAGDLWIDVDKSLFQSNDVVAVSGTLINTGVGTVVVNNLGSALSAGDRFVLFDGQSLPNGGAMVVVGAGAVWQNDLAVDGSITVLSTTIPQPTISEVAIVGTNLLLSGSNGTAGGGYLVESHTNVAEPLPWPVVSTGVFDSSGNFISTNGLIPGEPQRFYLISIP